MANPRGPAEAKPLPAGATPEPWGQISLQSMEREIRIHRNQDCPYYSICLDYAAFLHWKGWTCRWCSHYSAAKEAKEAKEAKPQTGATKPRKEKT